MVFSSFVMLTLTYGARYSFGVFVKPMFADYNWPMTVISLAASIHLLINQSISQLPDSAFEKPSLKPILLHPRFRLLVVCNIFAVMTVMMTFVHQVAYAINNGIDKIEAAAAIGIIGIMGSCGKFFFRWLSDRIRDAKYSAALSALFLADSFLIKSVLTDRSGS